jgi:hypothetical protein
MLFRYPEALFNCSVIDYVTYPSPFTFCEPLTTSNKLTTILVGTTQPLPRRQFMSWVLSLDPVVQVDSTLNTQSPPLW